MPAEHVLHQPPQRLGAPGLRPRTAYSQACSGVESGGTLKPSACRRSRKSSWSIRSACIIAAAPSMGIAIDSAEPTSLPARGCPAWTWAGRFRLIRPPATPPQSPPAACGMQRTASGKRQTHTEGRSWFSSPPRRARQGILPEASQPAPSPARQCSQKRSKPGERNLSRWRSMKRRRNGGRLLRSSTSAPEANCSSTTQRDRQLMPSPAATLCLIAPELPRSRLSPGNAGGPAGRG